MEQERVKNEMHELEEKIKYDFTDISWLSKAMGSIKIEVPNQGKNASEYGNEALATVGDSLLKFVLADYLYGTENITTKGELTSTKSKLENNTIMHNIMLEENLIAYAYNSLHFYKDKDIPEHEKVVCNEHEPYIEAIVAAVYYDSDYETTKDWIIKWLLPLLKKYQNQ